MRLSLVSLPALGVAGCLPEPADLSPLEPSRTTPVLAVREVTPSVFDPLTVTPNESYEFVVPFTAGDCDGSATECEDVVAALFFEFDGSEGDEADITGFTVPGELNEERRTITGTWNVLTSRRGCQRLFLVVAHQNDWRRLELQPQREAAVLSWVVFIEDPTNPTGGTGADCLEQAGAP